MTLPKCSCIICKKEFTARGILTHHNQSHNDQWKASWNAKNSSVDRSTPVREPSQTMLDYNARPKVCICSNVIPYAKRRNTFCSSSCSASHNNKKRTLSCDTKQKISKALTGRTQSDVTKQARKRPPYSRISFANCKNCNTLFTRRGDSVRVSCSRSCQIHLSVGQRPYINGRRKLFYVPQSDGTVVMLESSWEHDIAKFLDQHDIKWERPAPIEYIGTDNAVHLYYPDFFLTEHGLYLDPKNPSVMATSIDKMSIIAAIIPIWYGDYEAMKSELTRQIVPASRALVKLNGG